MGKGRNFAKAVRSKVTPTGQWADLVPNAKTRFTITEYRKYLKLLEKPRELRKSILGHD